MAGWSQSEALDNRMAIHFAIPSAFMLTILVLMGSLGMNVALNMQFHRNYTTARLSLSLLYCKVLLRNPPITDTGQLLCFKELPDFQKLLCVYLQGFFNGLFTVHYLTLFIYWTIM